jgi:iron complex transport system substrate-binding protein
MNLSESVLRSEEIRMRFKFLMVLLLVLGFCFSASAASMTVTDMAGRIVAIKDDPRRIICLGPGALRLIVYLEAQDRVVGVESMEKRYASGRPYWLAHPELKTLPAIGPGGPGAINKKPDMEAVLRVAPDLIFATYMEAAMADEVANTLGIPVVVLNYGDLAVFDTTVYESIKLAGKILGRSDRAHGVIDFIEGARADLGRRAKNAGGDAGPSVFVGGIGHRGVLGIESTQRDYIPLDWNHARNAAQQVQAAVGSHVMVDKEMLLRLDPDVIFLDGAGVALVAGDYRKKPDFYNALKAFRQKRVYGLLPFNYYTTNIGTAMADAYAIGKTISASRFSDVDLAAKADGIYTFLVGRPVYSAMQAEFGSLGQVVSFIE